MAVWVVGMEWRVASDGKNGKAQSRPSGRLWLVQHHTLPPRAHRHPSSRLLPVLKDPKQQSSLTISDLARSRHLSMLGAIA